MKQNFDGDREREGTRISFSAVSPELNESVVEVGGGSATVPEGAMGDSRWVSN